MPRLPAWRNYTYRIVDAPYAHRPRYAVGFDIDRQPPTTTAPTLPISYVKLAPIGRTGLAYPQPDAAAKHGPTGREIHSKYTHPGPAPVARQNMSFPKGGVCVRISSSSRRAPSLVPRGGPERQIGIPAK